MATFERGFKTWCERTAAGIRRSLNLAPFDPLDPRALAAHLEVTLLTPQQIPDLPSDVCRQLLETDPWGWSAVTLETDEGATIIYNPRKSEGRQASDLMHELAHLLLGHQPATLILSHEHGFGMRSFDPRQEDEANWLAWALLLPREALLRAKRQKLTNEEVANRFGVTERLVRFRSSVTGVDVQVTRRLRGPSRRASSRPG